MLLEKIFSRKILLYLIFLMLILWTIFDKNCCFSPKNTIIVCLFLSFLLAVLENMFLKYKLNQRDSSYKIAKKFKNGDVRLYDACVKQIGNNHDGMEYLGVIKDTTENDIFKERILIQNAQLSSILNNMPFVIYLKDTNGKFIAGNKKLESLFNLKNSELVGKKAEDFYLVEHAEAIKISDSRVVKNRETVTSEYKCSLLGDGYQWLRVIKTPVVSQNNRVLGIIVVLRNIDKEKELEHQRDTFVATLTHDLKTPTRAQLNVAEILLSGSLGPLTQEQYEMIYQLKNSNVYMYSMISTILEAYKSENVNLKLEPESFDFFELVNDTCQELASLAETREQKLILKSNLKDKEVTVDKLQIKRAITNLVSNAILHGFEKSEVIIQLSDKKSKVLFEVKNNSRYLDEERRAEIFEKYKSAKYSKSNKASTGLGLYLSRDIIRKHHGDIYVNSWKNDVCVFGFVIPRYLNKAVNTKQES